MMILLIGSIDNNINEEQNDVEGNKKREVGKKRPSVEVSEEYSFLSHSVQLRRLFHRVSCHSKITPPKI